MAPRRSDQQIEDPSGLLAQPDHMRDMERLEMELCGIALPFPGLARVRGRISPADPAAWALPNVAVRIEVETPPEGRPVSRVYTIRSFDPARAEVEIDFVLHPDDSPAMRWLRQARPGNRVWMTGPRPHFLPDHAAHRPVAIFADETAIPAVHAILRAWPEGTTGRLWVETANPAAFDELPAPPGLDRSLLCREGPAGAQMRLLAEARRSVTSTGWTVWAAGERQEMRALRSHFLNLGYAQDQLRIFGYWRQGTSSSEIDRQRLREYADLRRRGLTMEALQDADLPI